MNRGMDLLYRKNDPYAAEQVFRQVLDLRPSHYGATYQLATALDHAGRPAEARPIWENVLRAAESVKDDKTAASARARLAAPDTISEGGYMMSGLHLLYRENRPAEAVEKFREVLDKRPTHYGATYQLAVSLDRSGKRDEARPLWEKVLAMATSYNDRKTADAARARLNQNP